MKSIIFARARGVVPDWDPEHSLASLILLLIAAQALYFVIKSYLEYRVHEILAHYYRPAYE